MQGNTTLVKHGIAEDESDYRMHVGFAHGKVYVFPTQAGQDVLNNGKQYKPFRASQPGVKIVTGTGYKVPWSDIADCMEVSVPAELIRQANCRRTDNPSAKGRKAVFVASELFKRGLVRLPLITQEIQDHDMQVKGKDLIIIARLSIQIKCDFWCAQYGLSLQTHECNPLGRY